MYLGNFRWVGCAASGCERCHRAASLTGNTQRTAVPHGNVQRRCPVQAGSVAAPLVPLACLVRWRCRRGQYHGSGEYKSRNGTFFAGCWVGGKRHGPGQVRYATGKTMLQIYENGKLMSEEVEMGEGDFDVDAE